MGAPHWRIPGYQHTTGEHVCAHPSITQGGTSEVACCIWWMHGPSSRPVALRNDPHSNNCTCLPSGAWLLAAAYSRRHLRLRRHPCISTTF